MVTRCLLHKRDETDHHKTLTTREALPLTLFEAIAPVIAKRSRGESSTSCVVPPRSMDWRRTYGRAILSRSTVLHSLMG